MAKVNVTVPSSKGNQRDFGLTLPPQDYDVLRRKHLSKGTLFEDQYFPADDSTLFFSQKPPRKFVWKRPQEICSNPKMFVGGADRLDVKQGILGDCWLLAAMASLCSDQILLTQVVPPNQEWSEGYAGIFYFRFWHFGTWIDVCIDDRLPTYNNKLIFTHSESNNEFWPALLEKAYAKLHGSYEALKGGKTAEAMEDFTGGVVESYDLTKETSFDLFRYIKKSNDRLALLSCSIKANPKEIEAKLNNGLIKGHAYSITDVKEIPVKGRSTKLIRVRNPWGNEREWKGAWSDGSKEWSLLSESEKKNYGITFADDGEFWMSYDDFKRNYTDIEICNITLDQFDEDETITNWNSLILNGNWRGSTAGGCRNFPSFTDNPQYAIDLSEDADGDGKCSILVALMQKNRRQQKKLGVRDLCIGYAIYKAPDSKTSKVDKKFTDYNRSVATSGSYTNSREVFARIELDPGRYIIIPSAFKPGEEGDFLLRIFTETTAHHTDESAGGDGDDKEDPRKKQLRAFFNRLAGDDNEIDAEELQDILTTSLKKDKLVNVFDISACRVMISMLDIDGNGTLDFEEFSNLLEVIGQWKSIFYKVDKNRSGTMEKNELNEALKISGFTVSTAMLNGIFLRYAKKRSFLNFDDFVACLASLKLAVANHGKLTKKGETAMSLGQYLQIALNI